MKKLGIFLLVALSITRCGGGTGGSTVFCERRYGDYVTNDRAINIRNSLEDQGYRAWIEYHGSYLDDTRTYVVFMEGPCY